MPRKKKSAARNKLKQKQRQREIEDEEQDEFEDQSNFVSFMNKEENEDIDDLDNEVMPLSDEEDDEDVDFEEEEERKIDLSDFKDGRKKKKKPEHLRDDNWENLGKKKAFYYNTDYVDSEAKQSDEEAEEEEVEVIALQRKKSKQLTDKDYADTFANLLKSNNKTSNPQLTNKDESNVDILKNDLSNMVDNVEKLEKDLTKITHQQKLDIIQAESPELIKLLLSFKEKIEDLKTNIEPLITRAEQMPTSEGVSYLQVKFHLLLSYIINLCYYLSHKASGKSVKDHPVIQQLVRIRTILEKLRPLDTKLKYQIEKLLKMAATLDQPDFQKNKDIGSLDAKLSHKVNLKNLELPAQLEKSEKVGKYIPPKRVSVLMDDRQTREERNLERAQEMAKRSQMAKMLAEEYGDAPVEYSMNREFEEENAKEIVRDSRITDFEEDNFIRVDKVREQNKAKQKLKKSKISDGLIEFEQLSDISALGIKDPSEANEEDDKFFQISKKRSFDSMVQSIEKKEKEKVKKPSVDPYGNDIDESELLQRHTKKPRLEEEPKAVEEVDEEFLDEDIEENGEEDVENGEEMDVEEKDEGDKETEGSDTNADKRKVDRTIEKNIGMKKKTKKNERNPRTKNKRRFKKAMEKNRSKVQKMRDNTKRYTGEERGINTRVVKSRNLK